MLSFAVHYYMTPSSHSCLHLTFLSKFCVFIPSLNIVNFTETRLGFEERETTLRKENKDLMVRSHELEEQNKSLLDQFTQLSDKMAAVQRKLTSSEVWFFMFL